MLTLTTFLSALCFVAIAEAADTVLYQQFCQNYYNLNQGNCENLRSNVRSMIRGRGTPTLEMGDSETQPAMVFFHSWPDTSASFANQFAEFCGEQGGYFCVAPSWIDYHPDFPRADVAELLISNQIESFHAVVEDLGLTNITLVTHNYIGYPYTYQYPNTVRRFVALDIGMHAGPATQLTPQTARNLKLYQKINIRAFLTDNDRRMMRNVDNNMGEVPCHNCRIAPPPIGVANITGIGARTAWPYYDLIRVDYPWTSYYNIPLEEWDFDTIPSFPEGIPVLFLYRSRPLYNQGFLDWIDGRDGVSEQIELSRGGRYSLTRIPDEVNSNILDWLIATENYTLSV